MGRLEGIDAHPPVVLPHVELHALARRVPQREEGGTSRLPQRQRRCRSAAETEQTEPEDEATVLVAPHEPVGLERGGQPVGGGPAQAGVGHQLGQRPGTALEHVEHVDRLVEDADAARPALERLRDATGESVQLYVPRGDVRVCVVSLESPHGLRTIVPVGATLPMDVGSAAKVFAGAADRKGWAESVEERERGVASVSAPVRRAGGVVAAVSVSGPIERTTRQPGRRYAAAVCAAADEVTQAIGR